MLSDYGQWQYPKLAKPESDGIFCYQVQRRISVWFSVRLARFIGPNTATGIDLLFGIAAALLVLADHWLWGVLLIQVFGIFSCIDGEIARIQGRSSRIGDFLDTLTDRSTELLLVGAVVFSLADRIDSERALTAGFALLGGVFLLTTSSEKFRSAWHMAYPKRRLERLLCLFCAGSEARLLMLSIGLVVAELSGSNSFLFWVLWTLAIATYLNLFIRVGLIYRHYSAEGTSSE